MKMTNRDWTSVQACLEASKGGDDLWGKIEDRTWAKDYDSRIAIKLDKKEQALVDEAIEECKADGIKVKVL